MRYVAENPLWREEKYIVCRRPSAALRESWREVAVHVGGLAAAVKAICLEKCGAAA